MDRNDLVVEIVRRLGILLDKDDPAFVLVEINRIVLVEAVKEVVDELTPLIQSAEASRHRLDSEQAAAFQRLDQAIEQAESRIRASAHHEARNAVRASLADLDTRVAHAVTIGNRSFAKPFLVILFIITSILSFFIGLLVGKI